MGSILAPSDRDVPGVPRNVAICGRARGVTPRRRDMGFEAQTGRSLLRYESRWARADTHHPHGMTPATLQSLTASGIPVCEWAAGACLRMPLDV